MKLLNKYAKDLAMTLFLLFLSAFSYGTDIDNWTQFNNAYTLDNNSLVLTKNIIFESDLTDTPLWENFSIRGSATENLRKLDGDNQFRGFFLSGNKTLNFDYYFYFKNFVSGNGAVVRVNNGAKVIFKGAGVIFESNEVTSYGGAITAENDAEISFIDSEIIFNSNTALDGGAIDAYVGKIRVDNTALNFNSNTADNGGAISSEQQGEISFDNSIVKFNFNIAQSNGGAINIKLNGLISSNNVALKFNTNKAVNGGAISVDNAEIKIINSLVDFISNSASAYGGAVYGYDGKNISFGNAIINFKENLASDGGAIAALAGSDIKFDNETDVRFINNRATNNGGAIYIENAQVYLEAGKFIGNKANGKANDIYLAGGGSGAKITFNPKEEQSIVMDGGIIAESGSMIKKTGIGEFILKDNAKIKTDGTIDINGGTLKLDNIKTSIEAQELNIDNAVLGISVDFANNKASSVSAIALSVGEKSALSVNNVGAGHYIEGQRIAFIHTESQGPLNDFNAIYGGNHKYLFEWEGNANNWTGYLIYQWRIIQPAFYANLRTIGVNTDSLYNGQMHWTGNKNDKVWLYYSLSGLSHEDDESYKGTFTLQSNSIKMGINIIKDGGIFAGYKGIKAKQREDEANISDIELGMYKEIKVGRAIINGIASLGLQIIDVKEGASFNTESIRLEMYATIADPKTIDMYAGIRGGYAIGDNIKDRNIELPSAGYGKLDIVGGLKKDYKAFSKLIFSGKVYLGLSAIDTGTEFDSSMGTVSGVEERGIIVGAGFALNYNLLPQMYLYTGLNSQTDSFSKSYSFYLGLNCKFGQEQIKSKPKARERERESKN